MSRDSKGRFVTGGNGGPGRPPGSRNKLAEDFLADICADWKQHGAAVIADVRNVHPAIYLRMVASLVSREQPIPAQSEFSGYTYRELMATLKAEIAAFERKNGEISVEDSVDL
jgi:hypothetical protein